MEDAEGRTIGDAAHLYSVTEERHHCKAAVLDLCLLQALATAALREAERVEVATGVAPAAAHVP